MYRLAQVCADIPEDEWQPGSRFGDRCWYCHKTCLGPRHGYCSQVCKDAEVRRQYLILWNEDPIRRLEKLVEGAFVRARKKNLPFDEGLLFFLLGSKVSEKPIDCGLRSEPPRYCGCCRVFLDYAVPRLRGRGRMSSEKSPSLDRIDPKGGYTIGNVAVICVRCNRLKSNGTPEDLEKLLRYTARHNPKQAPLIKLVPDEV